MSPPPSQRNPRCENRKERWDSPCILFTRDPYFIAYQVHSIQSRPLPLTDKLFPDPTKGED
jgi:hypothetical protein